MKDVEPHWTVRDGINVVARADGDVLVRCGDQVLAYRGLPVDVLRAVVEAATPSGPEAALAARLPGDVDPDTASALVRHLEGVVFERRHPALAAAAVDGEGRRPAVLLVGRGALATAIDAGLRVARPGWRVSRVEIGSSGETADGWERIWPITRDHGGSADWRAEVTGSLAGSDIAIVAAEGTAYDSVLDVTVALAEAGRPGIFVTPDDGMITIGPTFVPGVTACFECERRAALVGAGRSDHAAASALSMFATGSGVDDELLAAATAAVVDEVDRVLRPTFESVLAQAVMRLSRSGTRLVSVLPDPACNTCTVEPILADPGVASPIQRRALVAIGIAEDRAASRRIRSTTRPDGDAPRRVGILGGGTAGYLTALALRTRLPHLDVTLIESSVVPIIGVGEATTPRIVEFLHRPDRLGLDIVDFHRRVLPVWKLGVHYDWGRPDGDGFPWPFQYGSVHEALVYDGSLDDHCLAGMLMGQRRVPIFDTGADVVSRLNDVPFAYHLDNARFVRYLREEAERIGVRHVDARVVDAELDPAGSRLTALLTEDGGRLSFDLYVDCSGFRSLLLEQKLGSRYRSYGTSLFTDSAVVANVPHDGTVKPFTLAETMDNGWCWNIAFEDEDHRGYVFASAFTSLDAAADEMRRKNPGMTEPWSLTFRSGRHDEFWRGNVVAVGNAYAFVEPLASTSIHMTLFALDLLIQNFPTSSEPTAVRDGLNRTLGEMWDSLRGWLAVQYRFNRRVTTPFWRECHASVDLATATEKVELFRERAPLAYVSPVYKKRLSPFFLSRYSSDYFGQDYVYDIMLGGQHVEARWLEPHVPEDVWHATVRRQRAAVEWAMPAAAALSLVREERPDLLQSLVTAPSFIGEELY